MISRFQIKEAGDRLVIKEEILKTGNNIYSLLTWLVHKWRSLYSQKNDFSQFLLSLS